MTKFRFIVALLVLCNIFLVSALVPAMDEPDYVWRLNEINNSEIINNIYISKPLEYSSIFVFCDQKSKPKNLITNIEKDCNIQWNYAISKIIFILPSLLVLIVLVMLSNEINFTIAITSSILPSYAYYLSVSSHEQLVLILSLLIFLFIDLNIVVITLLALIILIDKGNGFIIIYFTILYKIFGLNIKVNRLIIFSILYTFLIIILRDHLLKILPHIPIIGERVDDIISAMSSKLLQNKYNIIERIGIVLIGFIFLSASYIKPIALYLYYIVIEIIFLGKIIKLREKSIEYLRIILPVVLTLITFVVLFPSHSNAKYFIFMTPFIILFSSKFISLYKIFLMVLIGNFIFFINLFLLRLL